MLEELGVEENVRWRMEDIYGKTTCNVTGWKIRNKDRGETRMPNEPNAR